MIYPVAGRARCGNWWPIILALALLVRYKDVDVSNQPQFAVADVVPLRGVVPTDWRPAVVDERNRVERIPYELCVLKSLVAALTMFNDALAAGTTGGVKVTTRRGEPWLSIPNMDKGSSPPAIRTLVNATLAMRDPPGGATAPPAPATPRSSDHGRRT